MHSGETTLQEMETINTRTKNRTVSEYWVTDLQSNKVPVLAGSTLPKQITWFLAVGNANYVTKGYSGCYTFILLL